MRCVRLALCELNCDPGFREFLLDFLKRGGRLLGPGEGLWPKLVTETCQTLGANRQKALWPAAGVEFAAAAIDVADDFADGDFSTDPQNIARTPNAGLALAWLAQFCVAKATASLSSDRSVRIATLLASGSAACCGGQDLDILLEINPEVTEARALVVSSRKAGSLAAAATAIGAACATDDLSVIELAGRFGAHVGIVAQLINDIAGIPHGDVPGSTDIAKRKKTLPVAYALACAREEGLSQVLAWYHPLPVGPSIAEKDIAEAIVSLGGLHYAWLVAKAHRQRAVDLLKEIEMSSGKHEVSSLRRLIPSVRPG